MHELSRISPINLPELQPESAPLCSEALILASASTPPLNAELLQALGELMSLAQARYPNQELPPGTETMYLAEWEEMVHHFGLPDFREALQGVLRDRRRPAFFPAPEEIEDAIRAKRREARDRASTKKHLEDLATWKAEWERERAEDLAARAAAEQTKVSAA